MNKIAEEYKGNQIVQVIKFREPKFPTGYRHCYHIFNSDNHFLIFINEQIKDSDLSEDIEVLAHYYGIDYNAARNKLDRAMHAMDRGKKRLLERLLINPSHKNH